MLGCLFVILVVFEVVSFIIVVDDVIDIEECL